MLLWLAGRAAGGVLRSIPRGQPPTPGPPTQEQRNTGIAGAVLFAFLFPVFLAIMTSAHSGHVSGKMMLWYVAAFIAGLLLLGLIIPRLGHRVNYRKVSRKYRPEPDVTVQNWLALADELERGHTRDEVIEGLLSVPCQEPPAGCLAAPGTTCSGLGLPVAVLSSPYPFIMVHLSRMNKAVRAGAVSAEDVRAQYGGKVPPGVRL
jgi:cytochrome b561